MQPTFFPPPLSNYAPSFRAFTRVAASASRSPHLTLAATAVLILFLEALRGSNTLEFSPAWPVLEAVVAALGFAAIWHGRHRLRLPRVLLLALGFQVGWLAVHLSVGMQPDWDTVYVYPVYGGDLLDGHFPRAEYPPGALLLFAFEAAFTDGTTHIPNALIMVLFQLVTVACVWLLGTRWSGWLSAVVALWPADAFFRELKFDAAPTAFLAAGLLLALRRRMGWAGVVLGLGAALKWTPALPALGLAVWFLIAGWRAELSRFVVGFAATFLILNIPFLLWQPANVIAAYTTQGGRHITGESLPYLPLRALGLASSEGGERISAPADVPGWAGEAAVVAQAALTLLLLALVARARNLREAVGLAALVPVGFLLVNRIFSPQWLLLVLACWAIAIALLARTQREAQALAFFGLAASLANTLVYPTLPPWWEVASAALFALALTTTAAIAFIGVRRMPREAGTETARARQRAPAGRGGSRGPDLRQLGLVPGLWRCTDTSMQSCVGRTRAATAGVMTVSTVMVLRT